MADAPGPDLVATLMRALPPELADELLSRMGPLADTLRASLINNPTAPPPTELDPALAEFFDLYRIVERGYLAPSPPAAGEYSPIASPEPEPEPESVPTDPIELLKRVPTDRLTRALDGEPPAAIALILSCLDPATAGTIMKGLPTKIRAEVAMRYSQPGTRNFALVGQISRAIVEKAETLVDQPSEPTAADRISDLAAMLRGIPREERLAVLQQVEATNPELATQLKAKLFRFEDLLKVEDRVVQQLLAQLNLKTIATALKSASEEITAKIMRNVSSRSREVLNEESEILGNVNATRIQAAQDEVVTIIRQYEEEGRITLDE